MPLRGEGEAVPVQDHGRDVGADLRRLRRVLRAVAQGGQVREVRGEGGVLRVRRHGEDRSAVLRGAAGGVPGVLEGDFHPPRRFAQGAGAVVPARAGRRRGRGAVREGELHDGREHEARDGRHRGRRRDVPVPRGGPRAPRRVLPRGRRGRGAAHLAGRHHPADGRRRDRVVRAGGPFRDVDSGEAARRRRERGRAVGADQPRGGRGARGDDDGGEGGGGARKGPEETESAARRRGEVQVGQGVARVEGDARAEG